MSEKYRKMLGSHAPTTPSSVADPPEAHDSPRSAVPGDRGWGWGWGKSYGRSPTEGSDSPGKPPHVLVGGHQLGGVAVEDCGAGRFDRPRCANGLWPWRTFHGGESARAVFLARREVSEVGHCLTTWSGVAAVRGTRSECPGEPRA
ncbi:hypothetical protein GCM10023084_28930 [Streptomyces lacrimifluminis]|uniref:Uncharacterized protein n=1 Tax=Streptomyces lacrimifluminis TaxID=1500077 RepID=A0A917NV52_9ACTN|nr:hypothetical protein GCM10012282_25550 [Streptomyces lacrimifluminis]